MKATLEFNLPEETSEHKLAVNGGSWANVVWDIDREMRKILKYEEGVSEEAYDRIEKLRERLYLIIEDNGVSMSDTY